ncbi:hypothetical protein [Zhenpiania hominis]|uniref:hypothetical protein n=1 Tax=Zhenpiania hominis TaxID=2763644 RepID=UPI0039F4E0C9
MRQKLPAEPCLLMKRELRIRSRKRLLRKAALPEQAHAAGRKSGGSGASKDTQSTFGPYATPQSAIQQLENALNACDLNRVME